MFRRLVPDKIRTKINVFLHAGDSFHCPLCGFNGKDLAPFGYDLPVLKEKQVVGAGLRPAMCYKCQSLDRERLVYLYLRNELHVFANRELKILHFAPEMTLSEKLSEVGFNKYVCGDIINEGYVYPDYIENMNVLDIPYEQDHFDLVICNHLLEHVVEDIDAMKEIYRVLKPGGKAIVQVPISKNSEATYEDFTITDPKEREHAYGQYDHVRLYGQDYPSRLESVGFIVERLRLSDSYPKNGLNPDEILFVANKPSST